MDFVFVYCVCQFSASEYRESLIQYMIIKQDIIYDILYLVQSRLYMWCWLVYDEL